ncbi:MAG: TIGR03809 family protein [Pseudomonadota bacterium]
MTNAADGERGRTLVARWRILAQRRLDHLVDLYQSGRWKLYHQEGEFLAMVQEARSALKAWEALAPVDPVHDKVAEVAAAQLADDVPGANPLANGVAAEHDLRKS